MAKTRKPKSDIEKAYDRQRNRLKRRVKSFQKRGYIFGKDPIPPKPKKITKASVTRLEKITPDVLYKKAEFVVYETAEIISGVEGRKLERQEAQRKAKETKKRKADLKKFRQELENLKDEKGSFLSEPPKPKTEYPSDVDVILNNFREMIEEWAPQTYWTPVFTDIKEKDKNILKNILEGAIREEGELNMAMRLQENATEIQSLFEEILYGSGSTEHHLQTGRKQVQFDLQRVATLLRGRSMTNEESIRYMQAMEEQEFEDA